MIPRRFFWLFDTLTLAAGFYLAYLLVPRLEAFFVTSAIAHLAGVAALSQTGWSGQLPPLWELIWILAAMVPTTLLFLEIFGNYRPLLTQSRTRLLAGAFLAPIIGLSVITLGLYATRNPAWSRLFMFSFALMSGVGLAGYRALSRLYYWRRQAAGYYAKNVVLIGPTNGLERLIYTLETSRLTMEYRLLGYLRLEPNQPGPRRSGGVLPAMGEVQSLGDLLILQPITEVIVTLPSTGTAGTEWLKQVVNDCDRFRVTLRMVPEALLFEQPHALRAQLQPDSLLLPALVLAPAQHDSEAVFFKRLTDVLVSTALLLLLLPLFILIGLAIKLTTPHLPILFRWRVVGQKGIEFTGYKFTTMQLDADRLQAGLLEHNEMTGPVFKIKDDPRVTPLGRFLRKYSLNELPQLWSVLMGDMSLVGPRPAFRHELERYELWHKRKLSIRPGITCLWQVRGRNRISNFDDWVKMDLEYIDNWSLWLDFKILVWTAWAVLGGTGS